MLHQQNLCRTLLPSGVKSGSPEYRKYKATFPLAHPLAPRGLPQPRQPCAVSAGRWTAAAGPAGWCWVTGGCSARLGRLGGTAARAGRLGRLGGDCCLGAESNAMSAVEEAMSAAEKLLQRWRRCGGLLLGTVVQRETGAHACGRAAGVPDAAHGEGYGIRAAAGRAGGWAGRRTAMPPSSRGGIAGAGPDDSCRGRVRDPPGAVRRRTRQRLLGGYAPEQSGVGRLRASDAGGSCGSPRPA